MQTPHPRPLTWCGRPPDPGLYWIDRPESAEYGWNCLLARRLVERGVRFVQLNQGGLDAHSNLKKNHDARGA